MNKDDHYISIQKNFIERGFLAGLTEKARTVYIALNYFKHWETKNCYPTISKLREVTGYHKETIIKACRELESYDLIKTWKNRREGNKNYKKFFHINPIKDISPLPPDRYQNKHSPARPERYSQKRDKKGRFVKSDSGQNELSDSVANGPSDSGQNGKELVLLNKSQRTSFTELNSSNNGNKDDAVSSLKEGFKNEKDKETIRELIHLKGKDFVRFQLRRAGRNPKLVDQVEP